MDSRGFACPQIERFAVDGKRFHMWFDVHRVIVITAAQFLECGSILPVWLFKLSLLLVRFANCYRRSSAKRKHDERTRRLSHLSSACLKFEKQSIDLAQPQFRLCILEGVREMKIVEERPQRRGKSCKEGIIFFGVYMNRSRPPSPKSLWLQGSLRHY